MKKTHKYKTFLIINLSCFGDVLLTNTLCQNIKTEYPNSKIVFMVHKPYYEAAKYQYLVDDTICIDKKGKERGLLGLIKYANSCPYKSKIDASFIIYGNDRGIILSSLLKSKKRISGSMKPIKYLLTDIHYENDYTKMQDRNANFLKMLTGKTAQVLPIRYNTNPKDDFLANKLLEIYAGKDLIAFCPVTEDKTKNMPIETSIELISKIAADNKTVLFLGQGNDPREYANELKKRGCINFVDLVDVTSIYQLANIMSICKGLISIDTGTLHLGCAIQIPTVSVFYRKDMVEKWAPHTEIYNSALIQENQTAENIYNTFKNLVYNPAKNSTLL